MLKKKIIAQRGITIIELVLGIVFLSIVMFGVGVVVVDSQRGWHRMYERIYSDVVTDSYVARKTFDRVIRKASGENLLLSEDGSWVEVYYYADANSTVVDRYALFYHDSNDGQLNLTYGSLDPRITLDTDTVCGNVSSCVFKAAGVSAQMILTLDNGSQTATVISSSVMHNQ